MRLKRMLTSVLVRSLAATASLAGATFLCVLGRRGAACSRKAHRPMLDGCRSPQASAATDGVQRRLEPRHTHAGQLVGSCGGRNVLRWPAAPPACAATPTPSLSLFMPPKGLSCMTRRGGAETARFREVYVVRSSSSSCARLCHRRARAVAPS